MYIEGETLEQRIEKGPLPLQEALDIGRQLADGLQAAHAAGVVHRDIKPGNVIITPEGRVKILDFGLALLTEGSKLTQLDSTVGTIAYMSPEQTQGSGTDHRKDIWALGVVLYEMVTGQQPFRGDYDKAVMYSILNEDPEPLTSLRTAVPVELEITVNKAIAKPSDERYQNIGDLVVDIKALQKRLQSGHSRVVATAPPVGTRHVASASRLPWLLLAGTSIIAIAVSVVHFTEASPDRPVRRFSFTPEFPDGEADEVRAAISPDGRWIAYVPTSGEPTPAVWLRPIDREEPRQIEGTEGTRPGLFWSPDSNFIGFAAGSSLKKVSVQGGPAIVLCELSGSIFAGGSWAPDGESIVFSSDDGNPFL